jgi:hypothetical protein
MNAWTTRVTTLLLAFTLCGVTELTNAMAFPQASTPDENQQSPQTAEQTTVSSTDAHSTPTQAEDRRDLPDSPGAAQSASQNQDNQSLQEPRGTAAARAAKTQGGAASKPAGAAIAPAKQRRTRSLLIKLGVIAGAGAALGTVYALAKGSPSRPPGAH